MGVAGLTKQAIKERRTMTRVEQEIRAGGNYTAVPNGVALEKTTFWFDFTVAEKISGVAGVKDTYKRAFDGWKEDIRYLTALYITMNWKGGEWYEKDMELSKLYYGYQQELDKYIFAGEREVGDKLEYDNFNQDEVRYFIQATD